MNKGRRWIPIAVIGVLVAGVAGVIVNAMMDEAAAEQDRLERRRARIERQERQREQEVQDLRQESGRMMPAELPGVELGMLRTELEEARTVSPKIGQQAEGQLLLEEELSNGARVLYGISDEDDRLVQVQVMSTVDSAEAIGEHLSSMIRRYGQPTGIWNCPRTGNVPTRRFTWRRSHATIADVFLLYGNRAALTFYLATNSHIGESLQRAACRPISGPQELGDFPTASLEQIREAQQGNTTP